jgi:ankyrin repeat protein
MVRWLIGKGLDVNAVNRNGQTPICMAAARGQVENLRILIEHGAKANHARPDGRTPFLIAAACGREEVCQFLLFNGHATLNERGTPR